jgi:hypothetical protein
LGDAVDVGRLVAHHAIVIGADIPVAYVIALDDEDIGFLAGVCLPYLIRLAYWGEAGNQLLAAWHILSAVQLRQAFILPAAILK